MNYIIYIKLYIKKYFKLDKTIKPIKFLPENKKKGMKFDTVTELHNKIVKIIDLENDLKKKNKDIIVINSKSMLGINIDNIVNTEQYNIHVLVSTIDTYKKYLKIFYNHNSVYIFKLVEKLNKSLDDLNNEIKLLKINNDYNFSDKSKKISNKSDDIFYSNFNNISNTSDIKTEISQHKPLSPVSPMTDNILFTIDDKKDKEINKKPDKEINKKPDEDEVDSINKDEVDSINKDEVDSINKDVVDSINEDVLDSIDEIVLDSINEDVVDSINKDEVDSINKDVVDSIDEIVVDSIYEDDKTIDEEVSNIDEEVSIADKKGS